MGNVGVGLGLEGGECLEEFAFAGGGFAFFEESLVDAGVSCVVCVFGEEELVFPFQLAGAGVDVVEGGDVRLHFLGSDFAEVAGAEEAFEFLAGEAREKVRFPGPTLVSQGQIGVSQPSEVEDRRDFDPAVFAEFHAALMPQEALNSSSSDHATGEKIFGATGLLAFMAMGMRWCISNGTLLSSYGSQPRRTR